MDKKTKGRLGEIRQAIKKYGFDEILGQTAKSKIRNRDDDTKATSLLLDDEVPVKLRLMLQELGTTFIKLGQLLSTRPDIVGEKISGELANLQDDNPAISYEQVKKIVERELNGNIDELFEDFSQQHLATASIGQVHEAKLITGERVAVKVQKEGITDKIDLDIRIMKYVANRADKLNSNLRKLNLPGIMEEFDRSIHKEIDYNNEFMNMQRIELNFEDNPEIHIPETYSEYCSSKVLTMEFIDGTKLNDVYVSDSEEFDKKLLAKNVLDSYLQQLFIDGFFHGDPHPGNIMILEDNVLCYLDLGMMGFFDEEFKKNLSELMILFVDQDVDGLINQLMYMDILDYDIETRTLKRDMNDLFGRYFGVELNRFDGVLEELLNLMQEYGVILPNEFVTMARGLSMVEAIAENLDPQIDVFASIKPIAKQVAKERIDPKRYFKSKKSNIILYEHMIQALPKLLTRTIHKIDNEELQFKFEVDITDKVSIIALISALIVGSSVVSFGPMVFDMPLISLIGYIIAIILSIIGIKRYVLK
ncbi:MAG: AarF/ABC1/UbiB kinase family protein [Methanobrevibacter sp.]|uniref:ABC1 kinase family protein n=1 Tax=Methanobrevibacter sp. TaxID=66852 RepID=UPI0025FF7F4B|nr:AarF/ABC1/UbiB kinase family protein [Methanobrevibacter sp.]MBQ6100353.1 AarF/ABC1/UbiB kinase family protein [Methanobrevibacter sp.]